MIVFFHLYNDRSGSPKVLLQTIRALSKAGYEVETLTSDHLGGFLDNVPGVKREIFYRRFDNKIATLACFLLTQINIFFKSFQYINKDAVFHINTMLPFGAALAGWIMRKKIIYHIHETSVKPALLKRLLRFFISLTATRVIFVSKFLSDEESFLNKNNVVIYNSTDFIPKEKALHSRRYLKVLMVCSLKEYKGVNEFLDLAKKFDKLDEPFKFTLVLNSNEEEIGKYFFDFNIPSNLSIIPRQSNLATYYENSDVLLNLSRPDQCIETYGLTIVEGMSYGLPVIVPPVGGPKELVEDGVQGYLESCYEIDKISSYIMRLNSEPELYKELSLNARKRSLDFSPEVYEKKIVDFYSREIFK
tara:strand:- start:1099 stop:2178 length:1080 start_codon:yes stop_codon:yes gene_type:complete